MARAQFSAETAGGGAFVSQPNRFTGRVTPHSTSPPGGGTSSPGSSMIRAERWTTPTGWCKR